MDEGTPPSSARSSRSGLHQLKLTSLSSDVFLQELEGKFPGQLEIEGEGTPETTGYLEVQIVGGALLHSKKGGDG